MDKSLPLNELSNFTQKEKDMITTLGLVSNEMEHDRMKPSKQTVQNILNYSKAHSCRKSKILNQIEMILN
jgi:hypothetical protein